jgi:CBS-domain-containing membrane protein
MTYATLPTYRFAHGATITQAQPPQPGPVTLDSPALSVMTDLATVRAATIHPHTPLSQAEAEMMHQGVRLLFVVKELAWVDGVVTLTDLLGDRPLMLVHQRQMKHHDINVADVMTPLGDLDAIHEASLVHASVGDVVATLLRFGRPYLLVIEAGAPGAQARIRGLISASQVERQLGAPLPSLTIAATFAEITRALDER